MLILRVDPKRPDAASLKKAAAVLKSGGLVVYPTETAYALGCDPKNPKAMKRLFSAKRRDASKPLPMIAAAKSQAFKYARPGLFERILADAFWPGPLTLVLPVKKQPVRIFAGAKNPYTKVSGRTVALRVSPHPVAAALSRALGRPVISTSANLSGHPTAYEAASVLRDLGTLPDLVLDGGRLRRAPVSTIARFVGGVCEILREGPITEDDLHRALMRRL